MKQILIELDVSDDFSKQLDEVKNELDSKKYNDAVFRVYSGIEDAQCTSEVVKKIYELFPDSKVLGTMSAGEISQGHLINKGVLISVLLFETSNITTFRYDNVKGIEHTIGEQICSDLNAISDIKAAEMIFPGTEINTRTLFEKISHSNRDIMIFGGYSGGHAMNAPDHFVFDENGRTGDSIYVTAYAGKDFHINAEKSIGWEPLGLPFRVTGADGNRLIELDGRPASEVYENFLNIDRTTNDNAEEGYTFPFLTKYNNDEWLRSAIHIEEDGSLNLHGYVMEGMDIQLSYGNPSTIFTKVNERLEQIRSFKPQVINLYSCIVRKSFWGTYVDVELTPFESLGSTSGIFTWGEILRNMDTGEVVEHNVTLLSIAMREGEAPQETLPKVQMDDSILQGPIAQLRRLTGLVYSAMGQLQQAHSDMRDLNSKLADMAEHDALTGLYNRGKTEELINSALNIASATNENVGLIMLDIDHFKSVNDTYGHHTGDVVLKETAKLIAEASRQYDDSFAGRWGGEEFFLVIRGMDDDALFSAAEELRKKVADHVFPHVGHVTISAGTIAASAHMGRLAIFASVDAALYQAKESGRNRVLKAVL